MRELTRAPLSTVCEIAMGQAPKGVSYNSEDSGYPLIAGAGDFGEVTPVPGKWTNAPTKLAAPGDIILCIRATIGDRNWADREYCLGRGVAGLRPIEEKLEARYLWHWLELSSGALREKGRGATFLQVSKVDISTLEIPLPPLSEQKRIAGILDAADTLRAKRRESLTELDAFVQSTFIELFGDPVNNPMGWPSFKIGELFDVARGGSPRPIERFLTSSCEGVNWIMIGDAPEDSRYIKSTKKKIRSEGKKKSRLVKPGDFLLTNSMSFGRPYILKTYGCIHDGWLVLSPKDERIQADYFYNLLCTDALYREFSRRAAGAVVKNLNINLVKGVSVASPPRELQHRFAAIVESVEQQKTRVHAQLTELNALFASLQSRAFNGDL